MVKKMKGKYSGKKDGKGKEGAGKGSKPKAQTSEAPDEKELELPVLPTVDKSKHLNCYTTILAKPSDAAVGMENLDRLQPELELMLSTVAVRYRSLQAAIAGIGQAEESRSEKAAVPTKKRKLNDSPRVAKSMKDLAKAREGSVKNDIPSEPAEKSEGKPTDPIAAAAAALNIILPRNDTQNKFWASIEPYIGEITENNIKELEGLLEVCYNDLSPIKIPPLGPHYTETWAAEDVNQERQASCARNKTASEGDVNLLKKASSNGQERTPGPLLQRLVSVLMDDPSSDNCDKDKDDEPYFPDENETTLYLGKLPLYHTTACFERTLRRELESMGFLENEGDETDEVLDEITKCEEELQAVAALNKNRLLRLVNEAKLEKQRQEIKSKINMVDAELVEIYKQTTTLKLQNKQLPSNEKKNAWKVLKDRDALIKELHSLA